MNAAFEMSIWLVIFTIFLMQLQFTTINSFTTVYRHSDSGRKLFGGYRILPRPCTVTSEADGSKPKTGVCMFNYECNQKKGLMIGSCIDGFLFGVCCSLPQSSSNVELENDDALALGPHVNILSPSLSSSSSSSQSNKRPIFSYEKIKSTTQMDDKWTRPSTIRYSSRPVPDSTYGEVLTTSEDPNKLFNLLITGSSSTHTKMPTNQKPILEHYFSNQTNGQFINNEGFLPLHRYPAPDTILLNPDGTVVEDDKNPEKVFTPKQPTYKIPSKPTTPSSVENDSNYGYVIGSNGLFVINQQHPTTKVEFITNNIIDATVSSVQKIITKTTSGQISGKPSQLQGSYLYPTQRPVQSDTPSQSHSTQVNHPKPATMTTASLFSKKTDLLPLTTKLTTPKPNPPYLIAEDNMVLLPTFTSQNKIKKPTTRVPTDSGQSTSKASYKPIRVTSKIPMKTTTSSNYDLDDKYSSYNYNFYTGSSKPPILITHPVGLDDNGQAISHILEILNSTQPKVESVTQSMNTDLGLSTWVSIIGNDKPIKNSYPKPGSAKPTATTFIHGPSYSVTSGGNKPAPTVVVISHDASGNDYHSKPTRRPVSTYTTITTNKLVVKRPGGVNHQAEVSKPNKPTQYDDDSVYHTGQENLISFPPVRNPDLNTTALNQMEKPTVVQTYVTGENELVHLPNGITLEVAPENVDLNTIDADEDYDEITTPTFQEDKVENQVHTFVEKIVNSLSGNFQDLEQILFNNENKTSVANDNGIQLNNIHMGHESDKITTEDSNTFLTTTRKPVRRPTTFRPPELADPIDTVTPETATSFPTKKPKPTTKKPSTNLSSAQSTIIKRPTTVRPSTVNTELIQKPTVTSAITTKRPVTSVPTKRPTVITTQTTKRPTTVTKRPTAGTTPTKRPTTSATTKRPTTTVTTTITTRRPTVTKKPKPVTTTKRPVITTPSTTTTTEEVTELSPDLATLETFEPSTEGVTVDYRRECGVRPLVKKGGRIVGGKGSQFGYYPWQVLVRESTWLGLFTKNKCGGVLITNRYVITAAHCQPGFLASLVAVFGEYDISGELEAKRSVAKNVRRVIVHRQYDPATFENDLALLELDSPITYEEHIVPICMPRDGEDYVGRMATVTGWGRLKYGGGVPSVLQEVRVPLIENSVCQEMFQTAGHQKRIISSFLCAGYANGQKDSCEGDSGGPLMVEREDGRWVLLGTVSHGIKCAAPYLPGVYMRTTYYKPWLKSITGVST